MTIVDAYNVLHVVPELHAHFKRDRQTAIQILIGCATAKRDSPLLVFDGSPPFPIASNHVKIVFVAGNGETFERADQYILGKVTEHRNVVVVSADRALCDRVRQLGGKVITPQEWYRDRATSSVPSPSDPSSVPKKGPGGTREEWVRLFKQPRSDPDKN